MIYLIISEHKWIDLYTILLHFWSDIKYHAY